MSRFLLVILALSSYRIAYIALCLENTTSGRAFREALEQIRLIDPENLQFGSPGWFWERYPNSYVLQLEPRRFIDKDAVTVGYFEARQIQKIRDRFFAALAELWRGKKMGSVMNRILLAGATGYLGSYLTTGAAEKGLPDPGACRASLGWSNRRV